MKRLILIIMILLLNVDLFAQNAWRNRMLLHKGEEVSVYKMNDIDSLGFDKINDVTTLSIRYKDTTEDEIAFDEIDSLIFDNVHGKVAANINIIESTINSVTLNVTRTASCVGYKLMCVPNSSIEFLSNEDIAVAIDENVDEVYEQDFVGVKISDLQFEYDTEYAVVAVGFDKYGLLCDVTKVRFETRSEDLTGNPDVDIEVVENNYYDFTVKYSANGDVSKYYVILSEVGAIEEQYMMFSNLYGWTCINDMIVDWGLELQNTATHQYTDKSPNMNYEIYVQALDANGVMAPYEVFSFMSKLKGGEGVANVDITLGEYEFNVDWFGEVLPSQYLTFTPNDQTSAYSMSVCLEENYLNDKYGYQEDLYVEPSMPTSGWFQHEELTTDYQINPNTRCVAIAAAKNINGEWGPVTELFFTTPDEEAPEWSKNPPKKIVGRFEKKVDDKSVSEEKFQSKESIIHLMIR